MKKCNFKNLYETFFSEKVAQKLKQQPDQITLKKYGQCPRIHGNLNSLCKLNVGAII